MIMIKRSLKNTEILHKNKAILMFKIKSRNPKLRLKSKASRTPNNKMIFHRSKIFSNHWASKNKNNQNNWLHLRLERILTAFSLNWGLYEIKYLKVGKIRVNRADSQDKNLRKRARLVNPNSLMSQKKRTKNQK